MIGVVAAVFFLGQFLEGNILQPKLVGSSVGLHPVWLMFALLPSARCSVSPECWLRCPPPPLWGCLCGSH